MAVSSSDLPGLVEQTRLALRVSSADYDAEVGQLADAALADMVRAGVPEAEVLAGGPLVRTAVACFAKARFGFDNADADRFEACYRQGLRDLMNSSGGAL